MGHNNFDKNWWAKRDVKAFLVFHLIPKCFTAPEWAEWKKYAMLALVGTTGRVYGRSELPPHCGDCTPRFQSLMKASGRCAHTEVKFKDNKPYAPRPK